jgi:hypothetical protein
MFPLPWSALLLGFLIVGLAASLWELVGRITNGAQPGEVKIEALASVVFFFTCILQKKHVQIQSTEVFETTFLISSILGILWILGGHALLALASRISTRSNLKGEDDEKSA